jgi:hypothetical protein
MKGGTTLSKRKKFAMSFITLLFLGTVAVAQKDGDLKRPDPAVLATENVKEILLDMDTDRNGKITREQWMKFMAEEFDRLARDKSGTLDPKMLRLEKERVEHPRFNDLGK